MKAETTELHDLFCLKNPADPSQPHGSTSEDLAEIEEEDDSILCRSCGSALTSTKFKISVNESHTHVFANPAGFVFEIACFSNASGCGSASIPSDDFSWFRGYRWMVSVCKLCLNHNGWIFESKNHFFYGLILDQIIYI